MSTVVTLVCMSSLAGFVYWYMPRDRPRKWFRLEQFCPAAPLAGIFDASERPSSAADNPTEDRPSDQSSIEALD
ncbi:hypothetical protein [Rhodococcus sp. ACT016]|uniref:hypothetical protein n=1 Tax=Rhodococcus sp. ACT016 TaxID=3134808 RepID=UPI003D26738F